MKIALVSEHASPLSALGGVNAGGQNVYVADLSHSLSALGADVTVYTRRDDPGLPQRMLVKKGVAVQHVTAGPARFVPKDDLLPHMGKFATELSYSWKIDPPDVVHAHYWMSGLASMWAAEPLGIPVIQTFHALGVVKKRNQGNKDTSPAGRLDIEQRLTREVDRIIATASEEVFELSRLGAASDRITVVPCGVDLDRFHPDGFVDDSKRLKNRLIVVSRLVERKGIGNVIEALPKVPDTELIIAGGPPRALLEADSEAIRLNHLARELGVSDRVKLLGCIEREDIPRLIRSADAAICIPWYEPFGMVAVEAMACGVPVIASSVGGLLDTVVDGVTGYHVPPQDPEALARLLTKVLRDKAHLNELGNAARDRSVRLYGWPKIAESTLSIFNEVTRKKTGKLLNSQVSSLRMAASQ